MSKGELTRQRILEAATSEFSAFGVAGARMDRIAESASANKSQMYAYFGDKERLFDLVLKRAFERGILAVDLPHQDLPAYAGALFDHLNEHPELVRLSLWRQLERPDSSVEGEGDAWTEKRARIQADLDSGHIRPDLTAPNILALVLAITQAWFLAPRSVLGGEEIDPGAAPVLDARRAAVVSTVRAALGRL